MSNNTNLFLKLNNYHFDEDYNNLYKYLKYGVVDDKNKNRFDKKYKDFTIINNKIIYQPLNLIVAPPDKKEIILKKLYDNFTIGINAGVKSFYEKVRMQYLNIKRSEVKEFLQSQEFYQLTKQPIKTTNKPIVVSYPNEKWS